MSSETPLRPLTPIREFSSSDVESFTQEMKRAERPAVLRGVVSSWPAVAAARRSPTALVEYLRRIDNGREVDAIMTPPDVDGRIFYSEGLQGFNFVRNRLPISAVAEQVLRYGGFARPPAVAAQSALIRDCLPGFTAENRLEILDEGVEPRIWLGNAITTPTHLDEWSNMGCVVAGRRRFTLFPPEQVANLYIGPLDYAPTGAPMSLVQLHDPDLVRFPRFERALAAAASAELGPGDAIFIPALWWHHVESLEPFNMLVNYWWHGIAGEAVGDASGFDSLVHALLNIRPLSPAARAAWRSLFDRYVFGAQEEVTAHIPQHRHGVLGTHSNAEAARRRAQLGRRLQARNDRGEKA